MNQNEHWLLKGNGRPRVYEKREAFRLLLYLLIFELGAVLTTSNTK